MNLKKKLLKQFLPASILCFTYTSAAYSDQGELINLSVEDLLNIDVISVSKKAKSLNDSPAAIFVITQDDIKRIGATSVPEALRLAPGLDIARIDSNKWAISARGFNGRFANKLLVLVDGRNTYTRAFAGVYWENQDVMLEDVERIEVIRGPGATLWGANAVNGVINIITKHSADTQGGLLVAGGGTEEQGFGAFRYGGKLNADTTARTYIKGFKRDESTHESGGEAGDDWDKVQGGFRLDSQLTAQDSLTLQGDAYRSLLNQNSTFPQFSPPYQYKFNETIDTFGGNLLARHQHTFSSTSDYSMQVFYDFYERDQVFVKDTRHVVDIDFQHRFSFLDWNDLIWGAGYRYTHDDFHINNKNNVVFPTSQNDQLFSAFVQDEITLIDNALWLTLGSKFEYNDYTDFEIQPTARLMWAPHHQHRLWAAVSRAVRTPSRLEYGTKNLAIVNPPQTPTEPTTAIFFEGTSQFDSEQVISYEIGYRSTMIDNVSIDFTAFYNDYNDLRSMRTSMPVFNPTTGALEISNIFSNNAKAQTYGFEIAAVWQMLDWWRWDANYSLLKTDLDGPEIENITTRSPQQHVSLRSSISPWQDVNLDILLRYVDNNETIGFFGSEVINDYFSMDIRLAWQPIKNMELSLVGQNLLAEQHLEYRQEAITTATEIDRGMYGKISWHF
jgi:iron complex outermembrane receptor protein